MNITKAIDYEHGEIHNYPPLEQDIHKLILRYDFIFTKNGVWYYISSSNDFKEFDNKGYDLRKPIEEHNESWAIVNNITGVVKLSNLN